ncbi:hypothetical protein CALVIDRAFT_538508 [Calocera viscosa TUFC12733]|uniref:F-box domain-containing protein n=1 Tax=Calocera viscosa (strain TUFC12733) TaxID=1330018 RepID=A0A167KUV6_CALVF|nr:hypothetical protein CALVIDRAFT_538508 [Calocera viscosa TUFC12733]
MSVPTVNSTRLPEDVWRHVFLLLVKDPTVSQERTTLHLGSVCRFWREIVLDAPDLWTSATALLLSSKSDATLQVDSEYLSWVLERARNRPVEVILRSAPFDSYIIPHMEPDLLAALAQHMSHISRLDISTNGRMLSYESLTAFHAFLRVTESGLETLSLDVHLTATVSSYGLMHLLRMSKGLRSLVVKDQGLEDFGGKEFILMAQFPAALQTLQIPASVLDLLDHPRTPKMRLLKSLRLSGSDVQDRTILHALSKFPSLEELELFNSKAGDSLLQGLCDKRIAPNLRRLEVDFGIMRDDAVVELLEARSRPPTFTMICRNCPHLTDRGWQALAKAQMQASLYLCPPVSSSSEPRL